MRSTRISEHHRSLRRAGVDTGGTFTDLVLLDEDNRLHVHKVRSTPANPALAILHGLHGISAGRGFDHVSHGSTVATNAVLERKGARLALLATAGFEDVLRIGRQTRRRLYDFQVTAPDPIVPSELTFGVHERLDSRGHVLEPLTASEIERLVALVRDARVDCVAVCLLHSYANPAHEDALAAALEAAGLTVSASHRILPEYREFERWSTTAVNAYVTPIMQRYLGTLERELAAVPLDVMQSNGGRLSARQAARAAVRTILSGPAAGAVGAQAIARASGFARVILFDMGGTSTDVSLVDGQLGFTSESVVGDFPVRLPMLDIHTVGAGGGSIARVDAGGALRVGPESAGADPGPACYGRGDQLTVSDANLLLGRLPARHFLGGRMTLDLPRTRKIATTFAASLGVTVERLAEGIVQIANANMEHAIRAVTVQRGHDPRDFALLAFGGAGGMHACEIAASMEIDTVLIPRHAGVLSAFGMLLADVRKDYTQTVLLDSREATPDALSARFSPLLQQAANDLAAEGFDLANTVLERLLDVRYTGQAYEITLPFSDDFEHAFHARHQQLYGNSNPARPVEIVNLRVNATGLAEKFDFPASKIVDAPLPAPLETAPAWFNGCVMDTPLYSREALPAGCAGEGPAVLAGVEATIVIPPGFRFRIDAHDTLIATRQTTPTPAAVAQEPA